MIKIAGLALATVLILSGCGGGGGDATTPVAALPAATSVSGTAAKGIIKQAKVLACRIVNGVPEPDASCASTTSGNDGAYSVVFSDGYTGPAMVKVMPGTGSTMVDETTGTDVAYNMTMRAVVPAVSKTTTVHVTPFSEMAASAVSTTTIDATKISQAIAAVEPTMSALGVDMTSSASMQTAMQNAGMTVSAAANTVNVVMGGMR